MKLNVPSVLNDWMASLLLFTSSKCTRGAMHHGSAARCAYPSSLGPFIIIWIALGCGDSELEMGGRRGADLSPSVLGTVLPQWSSLIGMQRGVSHSLPPSLSVRVSRSARPETDILMKDRGGQRLYEGRVHVELHTHTCAWALLLQCKEIHILCGCNPQDLQSSPRVSFHLASWIKCAEEALKKPPNQTTLKYVISPHSGPGLNRNTRKVNRNHDSYLKQ